MPTGVALLLLLLQISVLLGLNGGGGGPEPAGFMVLVSHPSGALVSHETGNLTKELGRTPLAVPETEFVKQGANRVLEGVLRLRKPGYFPESWQGRATSRVELQLRRNPLIWLPGLGIVLSAVLAWRAYQEGSRVARVRARQAAAEDRIDEGGRIGQYRLVRRLGRGAMAEVFQGQPDDGSPLVAVKVLFPDISEGPEFRERFGREVKVCMTFTHPRVVRCHSFGTKDGRLWMVQDYFTGGTLADLLKGDRLRVHDARVILSGIAEGLQYAHGLGIVHRDLKPENIFLDARSQPVIGDFGMARGANYKTITRTDATLGTPAYMPPEQVYGERGDHRADLYSLGCLAFEMFTGELPFLRPDPIQTILAQASEPAPDIRDRCPGLPEGLCAIVMRLLEKQPADRFADAGALLEALR